MQSIASTAVAGLDSDKSPVFYSSKRLDVTGMKVVVGGSVYPLSSIVGVDVFGNRFGYLLMFFQAIGLAVVVWLARWLYVRFMPDIGMSDDLMVFSLTLMGVSLVAIVPLALILFFRELELVIRLSDGGKRTIRSSDNKMIWQMHEALERAMTYHANASRAVPSVSDELGRLSRLLGEGVITEQDWTRTKDLFLGTQLSAQDRAVIQLEQLHALWRSGVLSESEFNTKKWEVLGQMSSRA